MPEARVPPCDVLVVGAGTAGVPAAVAAARSGLDVVVVERGRGPGGTPAAMFHTAMCGLFANRADRAEALHPEGLVAEIVAATVGTSRAAPPVRVGRVWVQPFSSVRFAAAARRLLRRTPGVRTLLRSEPVTILREGDTIREVALRTPRGPVALRPRVVVDASADGVVLDLAGVPHETAGAGRQLAGFAVRVAGLSGVTDRTPLEAAWCVARAVRAGALPGRLRFTVLAPGPGAHEASLRLSVPGDGAEARDLLADAARVVAALAEALPAFRDASVSAHSPYVAEREGRRLLGRATLTEDDVLRGRAADRPAARNAWPIELWDPDLGPRHRYLDEDRPWYEIPEDCLVSPTVANVVCAGRCLSATPAAAASARVMGPSLALGAAAGGVAARLARLSPRSP